MAVQTEEFPETHRLPGGEAGGIDNRMVQAMMNRVGSNIMGKRMFEEGEPHWPFATSHSNYRVIR
ncbi:MAG: hypothetical protein HY200_08755 [Nitrospirae bacterium]|nr:hypothetical protein [Nitrospirota bacterium]MBI3595033.1 hypothetical protein [Nitrospirota bacterium]